MPGKNLDGFVIYIVMIIFISTTYRDFEDLGIIYEYLDSRLFDNYLIDNVDKIMSGFYFNKNDIRFQIILKTFNFYTYRRSW